MSKSIERLVLERALEVMRRGWTHLDWAVDAEGGSVPWHSLRAVKFCAEGAIQRAVRDVLGSYGKRGARLAKRIIEKDFDNELMMINDDEGLDAVTDEIERRLRKL